MIPRYIVSPPAKFAYTITELAAAAELTTRAIWNDILAQRLPVARLGPGLRPALRVLREDAEAWWARRRRRGVHKAHELRLPA